MSHTTGGIPEMESGLSEISFSTTIRGEITFDGELRIYGVLEGNLLGGSASRLWVHESASIQGRMEAEQIWIEGYVEGDIHARGVLVLRPQARVRGRIQSPKLTVQTGAVFDGEILQATMVPPAEPEPSQSRKL